MTPLNVSPMDVWIKGKGLFASKVPLGGRAPAGPPTPPPAARFQAQGLSWELVDSTASGRSSSTCRGHWGPGPAVAHCPVGEMTYVTEAETSRSEGEATQDSWRLRGHSFSCQLSAVPFPHFSFPESSPSLPSPFSPSPLPLFLIEHLGGEQMLLLTVADI